MFAATFCGYLFGVSLIPTQVDLLLSRLLIKKMFKSLLILSTLFFSLPHAAMAESEPDYLDKAGGELENGIANAVGGFMEIPKTVIILSRSEGPVYGMTVGLMTGVLHTLGRTVYGVVDMATFMIPTKPLVDPDYVWNDFDRMTTYKPNVQMQ